MPVETPARWEALSRDFRSQRRLVPAMLERGGATLALATIELADDGVVLDLDDPRVLVEEGLRPSHVSTGERARTQVDAATLFDRAEAELRIVECVRSRSSTPSPGMPRDFLGLRPR